MKIYIFIVAWMKFTLMFLILYYSLLFWGISLYFLIFKELNVENKI